tara:strand:+ start:354 stop:1004 length:651 start_codon:yes stop_codon:yes gene_type:complete
MEDTRNDSGTIEPSLKSDAEEIVGLKDQNKRLTDELKAKQIGAIRIYDGALSPEFCDELVEVFDANHELHDNINEERIKCIQYSYSKNHEGEDVHEQLKDHIIQLYNHYLEDLNLPNMIAHKGLESLKIRKYDPDKEPIVDPHIDVVNHESAIRAIGFLFYLTDNPKMTNFPRQGVGVESIKGRVVIYPPSWEYPIIENMPEEGSKYNLQTYLHYA